MKPGPRWVHRVYAALFGYFWKRCPICRRYFGGHEWDTEDATVEICKPDGTRSNSGYGTCSVMCARVGQYWEDAGLWSWRFAKWVNR